MPEPIPQAAETDGRRHAEDITDRIRDGAGRFDRRSLGIVCGSGSRPGNAATVPGGQITPLRKNPRSIRVIFHRKTSHTS